MGNQYKAKTFKSGNSVALRLPAALGVEPGREMLVDGDADEFAVKCVAAPKWKIDLTDVWGSVPDFGLHLPTRREFDDWPSAPEADDKK
ncbi:AbrB/MazE/SpoVT family DNA-binding domain-containing protein [uncultured Sphingomonas sp.]|uniref:AbrB/MazE/SpoVT family DNA-binding domain-containing protein n=1 Tax=uncultured Sphingomonas sp. TaxID=158754 RepID=UPI0035CA7CF6